MSWPRSSSSSSERSAVAPPTNSPFEKQRKLARRRAKYRARRLGRKLFAARTTHAKRRIGALFVAAAFLASCQTTASVATSPVAAVPVTSSHWACQAFRPIEWSKLDTLETQKQVVAHNAAWKAVCS